MATTTRDAITRRPLEALLLEAVAFHGHECPGQVLGVRMAIAGCREVGIEDPDRAGKRLVVFVEIDRCAVDAIQAVTGVSVGKRTLKLLDYGKAAATFVDVERGTAVRVLARDDARARAAEWAPAGLDARARQIEAYRIMPERDLLSLTPVGIAPGWLDRRRVRVACERCGEGVNYQREVVVGGSTLCLPCAGASYYVVRAR